MSWSQTLDDLAAGLEQLEALLDGSGDLADLPAWAPPAELGPLPPELRRRAAELSDRIDRARHRLASRRDRVVDELVGTDRRRVAATSYRANG